MANNFYGATSLTGGGTGALDAIDGTDLANLDAAFVVTLSYIYFYSLDVDSGASESSPDVISPDTNAGNKRWILTGINAVTATEFSQLETMGTTTILAAQWGYVGAMGAQPLENIIEDTTPQLGGELDCQAHTIGFTQQTATGDGTTTIDWKLGNKFYFTFGAQNETFTFTAPTHACNLLLILKQDGTGSRTATWPATVKWPAATAPTLTTGANKIDIVTFYFDGTNYHGTSSLDYT